MLPGAAWVEKDAIYTNDQGRVQASSKANPPGEAREDWQILAGVAVAWPDHGVSEFGRCPKGDLRGTSRNEIRGRARDRVRAGGIGEPTGCRHRILRNGGSGTSSIRTCHRSRATMQMESGAASPRSFSEARGVAMHGRATAIALLVVVVIARLSYGRISRSARCRLSSNRKLAPGARPAPHWRCGFHRSSTFSRMRHATRADPDRAHVQSAGRYSSHGACLSQSDRFSAGLPQPLAVFEHEFAIGIQFAVAEGTAPRIDVPGAFGIRPATTRCAFHRRLPKSVGRSPLSAPQHDGERVPTCSSASRLERAARHPHLPRAATAPERFRRKRRS